MAVMEVGMRVAKDGDHEDHSLLEGPGDSQVGAVRSRCQALADCARTGRNLCGPGGSDVIIRGTPEYNLPPARRGPKTHGPRESAVAIVAKTLRTSRGPR